jgi:hypothetical protein
MIQISTPKFVEEVIVKVMQAQNAIELIITMAIVSLNMGNLNMEVKILKNNLATWEKEKAILQEEWIRKEISKRGISIMWKSRGRTKLKLNKRLKCSLKNCRMRTRSSKVA